MRIKQDWEHHIPQHPQGTQQCWCEVGCMRIKGKPKRVTTAVAEIAEGLRGRELGGRRSDVMAEASDTCFHPAKLLISPFIPGNDAVRFIRLLSLRFCFVF